MEPGQAIRTGIAASAIAHLSAVVLLLLFSEVHLFGSVTEDAVAVEIVTSEEVEQKKPEPAVAPETKPAFDLPTLLPPSSLPASAPAPAPAPASQTAAQKAPPPPAGQKTAAAQPPSTPPPPAGQPAAAQPPAYVAPQPDISVKYQVMLGLPPDMSPALPPAGSGGRPGEPFDAPASTQADIASSLVAEFRRHLKTCLKRPPSITPSDKLKIKLRVFMDLEARLAAEPVLIEASASPKGPALMQAAMAALQGCQPYAMLPADRYDEWKVLDLSFTPQDFAG